VARAGQQVQGDQGRLGDRITVGVLAKAFPRQLVEEAVDAAGAREQRSRMLPAWLTVYFVLGLALFIPSAPGNRRVPCQATLSLFQWERVAWSLA